MAKKKDDSMHWIIGIVLLVTGILIIAALVVTYSEAEDVNANVNIGNDSPVIDTANAQMWQDPGDDGTNTVVTGFAATPGPSISHTLGGNTNVIIKVNVQDSNGWASQPINLSARLTITQSSGGAPFFAFEDTHAQDIRLHPNGAPAACTAVANVSATERTFLCGINMTYNSIPTTPTSPFTQSTDDSDEHWRVLLKASDTVVNVEALDSVHYEFAQQIGINTATLIELGSIATDGVEGPLRTLSIGNIGNQQIDVTSEVTEVTDAAAWTCTGSGNPLVSDIHLAEPGTDTNYAAMDPLNFVGDPFTHADWNLFPATLSTSGFSNNMLFKMATTQGITPGTCTLSSMVLAAVKGF